MISGLLAVSCSAASATEKREVLEEEVPDAKRAAASETEAMVAWRRSTLLLLSLVASHRTRRVMGGVGENLLGLWGNGFDRDCFKEHLEIHMNILVIAGYWLDLGSR